MSNIFVKSRLSLNFLVVGISVLAGCQPLSKDFVCFKSQCVDVEIVQDEKTRAQGLQFRKSLGQDKGMLFVFAQPDVYSFWMKDTYIPLDMIWLDYSRQVVFIHENALPCQQDLCPSYGPSGKAMYVLEVNSGWIKKTGLKTGDVFEFRLKNSSL